MANTNYANYEDYKKEVIRRLENILGSGYVVELVVLMENNGLKEGVKIAPRREGETGLVVHLSQWYEEKTPIETVIKKILGLLERIEKDQQKFSWLEDFEVVRPKLRIRLMNTESNQELLAEVAHSEIPGLDLSTVCYIDVGTTSDGVNMTSNVLRDLCDKWNIAEKELCRIAFANTVNELPAVSFSISEILCGSFDDFMYVVTNTTRFLGATACLYPGVLNEVSDKLFGADLVIFPSSVHEVIIVPYLNTSAESICEYADMVSGINEKKVDRQDRLSNSVYVYRRETGKLSILMKGDATLL